MLPTPGYIQVANVDDLSIRYKWDDWNVEQAEEPINEQMLRQLKGISQRAAVAFTIATAEWIVHRFGTLCNDPLPLHYLEAAWADQLDNIYAAATWEELTEKKEWAGPIRGPIRIAMERVMYALEEAEEDGEPEVRALWITSLADFIMSDPAPYREWRKRVMERLKVLYPRNPEDTLGEVVPREALDPDFEFHIENTEDLINRFLSGLSYLSNPFLNSPEKMLDAGFEGKPYVFNIEQDRTRRFDW